MSAVIAVIICIPALTLMLIGVRDAGEEALLPKKEHTMYGGIYNKLRHPKAVGEVFLWWVIAFLLHSPFLALFSFIYIPIFTMMCFAEEQDLLWRYGDNYIEYYKHPGAFFPYDLLGQAYSRVNAKIAAHGLVTTGLSLEIYGHWSEDTAQLVTELLIGLQ